MNKSMNISCPNCSKSFFVNTEKVYTECWHCHQLFTVKVLGEQTHIDSPGDLIKPTILRLKNVEYLLSTAQYNVKKLKKQILFFNISKYFFIVFICLGIGLIFVRKEGFNQVSLMMIGMGLVSFLYSLFSRAYFIKKCNEEEKECLKLQLEQKNCEDLILEEPIRAQSGPVNGAS